jgi:hypothetical protein
MPANTRSPDRFTMVNLATATASKRNQLADTINYDYLASTDFDHVPRRPAA